MKIGKAIRTVRKLAKSSVREAGAMSALATPAWSRTQKSALKSVKVLLHAFDEDLAARSELTSLRFVAAAIACRAIETPVDPAHALEQVAELAMRRVVQRDRRASRDEISAVSIVRALAADIRALEAAPLANAKAVHRPLQVA